MQSEGSTYYYRADASAMALEGKSASTLERRARRTWVRSPRPRPRPRDNRKLLPKQASPRTQLQLRQERRKTKNLSKRKGTTCLGRGEGRLNFFFNFCSSLRLVQSRRLPAEPCHEKPVATQTCLGRAWKVDRTCQKARNLVEKFMTALPAYCGSGFHFTYYHLRIYLV